MSNKSVRPNRKPQISKERVRLPERKSRVTLAEVAKLANVAEITVSRCLRNDGQVSEDTRRRVLEAANLVGYVPNRIAGSLASARSNVIGVIIPSLTNIVFPEVLRGIHIGVKGTNLQPVLGITNYNIETEEELIRSLLSWKPAAMIITGFDHTAAARLMLERSGIRIAELMDIDPKPIDIAVGFSNHTVGMEIGRHLIAKGYKRFGYVGHDWNSDKRARLRYDGLVEVLARAGLTVIEHAIDTGPSSAPSGSAMTALLLKKAPDIDCIVFSNDDMALGGFFHCMKEGLRVPEDVAIFGFNGLEIGEALPKQLSTVKSNRYLVGKSAVETIMRSLDERPQPQVIDTGFEIISGETA